MLFLKADETDPNRNVVVRLTRRLFPITERFHGQHFFVRAGSAASHQAPVPGAAQETDRVVDAARPGVLLATPLFLALVMVEFTDLIFAVDSIPAIFAITADPFLVFTSNVFAILGLRSLYFALAGMIDEFRYLKVALAFVLMVVGVKMMTHVWLKALLGPALQPVPARRGAAHPRGRGGRLARRREARPRRRRRPLGLITAPGAGPGPAPASNRGLL